MGTTEEGIYAVPDGMTLYTKTWKVEGAPRAIVAFVHGFSDHCNTYNDFFPTLASHGIEVRAFDQRGWGRNVTTPKLRGLTGPTSLVLSDIHSFLLSLMPLTKSTSSESPIPLFLMGHSMGGGQVLHYVLNPVSPYHHHSSSSNQGRETVQLTGVLTFAPFIALHSSTRPWGITVLLGRLAGKLLPRFHLHNPLDPNLVSRDQQVCADYAADDLCHDTGTLEGLAGMLDRAAWLEKQPLSSSSSSYISSKDTIPPIFIAHGTGDKITSFDATKHFVDVLDVQDKTFKIYEGAYHKLHAEPYHVKEQLAEDIANWILDRIRIPVSAQSVEEGPPVPNIVVNDAATQGLAEDNEDEITQESKAKL